MKKSLLSLIAAVASGTVYAAPAPYPLPINSQAQTAPPVLVYRASETAFRVRFTDGSTASDITGCIPFMAWSTNANATGVATSSYSIVSATNGMVDFHFDPSAVNYAAGRYMYEVGVRSNAVPRVYRQGIFQIYNSPVGAGVSAVTWSTPVNWQALDWSNLPTITVNGVTGSIETNLSFTVSGSVGGNVTSVNGQTGTVTITASGLGAITNEVDTLALAALSTNLVTRLFDDTGTRWIDGTGGVWQVSAVTNSTMANWTVTVISDIKNGSGTVVATNGTLEVFSDPIGVPPLALSQYAIQNVVHGGYRWSIYRASDASQLTVFVQNIGLSASQYLSQNMNPPTYTNAICTAWPGGASAGQCLVTYTPIVYAISVVTSALPRVAFISDTASLLSTNGNGSALTDMTVSQIAGAYPASNPSNFLTRVQADDGYVSKTNESAVMSVVAAPGAPTVSVNATAGNLTGSYIYSVTFVTAVGETEVAEHSLAVTPSAQQVNVASIPVGPSGVLYRKLWRNSADQTGFEYVRYLTTISNNTDTTYTDNIADASLGVYSPGINTTGGLIKHGDTVVFSAGQKATTVGRGAGQNTRGFYGTFVGENAGNANTYAYANTAVGVQAMYSTTTGGYNTAVGSSSLQKNVSGSSIVAVGYHALYENTTGTGNTGLGNAALEANTTGTGNVGIGNTAGRVGNKTGNFNVYIGYSAGQGVANNSHSENTFVGGASGRGITTGGGNIALGYKAGDAITSGTKNIVIGYDIDALLPTSSYQLNIGGLIWGTGMSVTGTNIAPGSVGIGMHAPAGAGNVAVAGTVTASNFVCRIPRWIDEKSAGVTVSPNPSAAPTRVEVGGTGSGVYGLGWDIGDDGSFETQWQHGTAETNAVFPQFYYGPHAHVSSTATGAGANKATFVMKWQVAAVNGDYSETLARTNTVTFTAANTHYKLEFGTVTNNVLQGRDSVISRGTLYRIAGADDVAANVAIVDSIDFHIPVREYGSAGITGDAP